ncbi:MAG: alpha-amylase family glycosyl hydrolase [Defluviitaleaceae bacterium]|nr:alpha-amylase family glycosyl hydrolase [Defluviitaleaceae bacterium]
MMRSGLRISFDSGRRSTGASRRPLILASVSILLLSLLLAACQPAPGAAPDMDGPWAEVLAAKVAAQEPPPPSAPGPGLTWYQIFVYTFCDSDGDGIGDINGVTGQLDYVRGMGFDGIWLLPVHPSSTYHKYNVRDYYGIDPEYGTMDDFDALIEACKERGIKVILDLVVNHSDLHHPWFAERPDFYNISDTPGNGNWEQLPDGRWYECQFWGQMPDLDLENSGLRAELEKVFAFWLDRGVDGFRLDAIKDYTGNAETNIEILQWLSGAVKGIKRDAYLVGEVWDTTNSLYQYYASGVDSFFAFPFAGSDGAIAKTLLNANAPFGSYLAAVAASQDAAKALNPSATNAPFFTNHDMARASGFMRRDANLIKTAWGLSLMQPGDAFVYYGEELGMSGSGKDENKRAPMFWTDEPGAAGMTKGPPGMDSVSHGFPPAILQVGDPESIQTYVTEAVRLRGKYPHIGRGDFNVIPSGAERAGAALRTWQGSEIVVAYNVSAEPATLNLPGELKDFLSATGEAPEQQGDSVTLPGYCIAILTV